MVDTINMLAQWTLAPDITDALQSNGFYQSPDWYFQRANSLNRQTGGTVAKLSGYNERLGIIVRGKDSTIEWIQASLPRLLHGYNGRLIKSPQELDDSLELLFKHLTEISTAVEPIIEFTRVDLVLNFPGNPKRFILAHRNARHPWVRNEDINYGESGIRFPGVERLIQFYWKQKERADGSGFDLPPLSNSIRVELQLKTKKVVREVLGGGDPECPFGHLDFYQCYRKFRYALCLFDKEIRTHDGEKCSLLALIAECEAQGFKTSWGASVWDWYEASGQKPATVNRNRAVMQARKQNIIDFKWADYLPMLRFPDPVVDIYSDGREVEVSIYP